MSVVEGAVTVVEDLCQEDDGDAETSSWETSGTAGRVPPSKARLLEGRTWTLLSKEV